MKLFKIIYELLKKLFHISRILLRVTTECNEECETSKQNCHKGGNKHDK